MIVEGDKLIIDMGMELDEVAKLHTFLMTRLEYIDEIVAEREGIEFKTLALLQLLCSVKKSRNEIAIPLLEEQNATLDETILLKWDRVWM